MPFVTSEGNTLEPGNDEYIRVVHDLTLLYISMTLTPAVTPSEFADRYLYTYQEIDMGLSNSKYMLPSE